MRNISLNGEDLTLGIGKGYIVIDVLYLEDLNGAIITDYENLLNNPDVEKVFPYIGHLNAYLKFDNDKDEYMNIHITSIKKSTFENNLFARSKSFPTDTGLIMCIHEKVFEDILKIFSYDKLLDSLTEIINLEYWDELVNSYPRFDLGLISAPGIDSGFDFDGSGFYAFDI